MKTYVGTSGFTLQSFYPKTVKSAEKLSYFARIFPTVEINSTFYHLPRTTTLSRWQEMVPPAFTFSFKVFQGITHEAIGRFNEDLLNVWFRAFTPFETKARQHIMLFQFPANFVYHAQIFAALLRSLPSTYSYAFEFRHPSWFREDVYEQLISSHATLVYSDGPLRANHTPIWPTFDLADAQFSYFRFHGAPQLYYSSYSTSDLARYAALMQAKNETGKNVYAYFNNDAQAHASENAKELMMLLKLK